MRQSVRPFRRTRHKYVLLSFNSRLAIFFWVDHRSIGICPGLEECQRLQAHRGRAPAPDIITGPLKLLRIIILYYTQAVCLYYNVCYILYYIIIDILKKQ